MQGKLAKANLDGGVVWVQCRKCTGKERMPRAAILSFGGKDANLD